MREAVGGSLLLYLFIPIIILIIFFVAFIMNYASAYRAANYVVTQIENCQGRMNDGCNDMDKIYREIVSKYHYHSPNNKISPCYISNGSNSYVFRVSLPVSFEMPMIGNISWFMVNAETKTIQNLPSKYLNDFGGKC